MAKILYQLTSPMHRTLGRDEVERRRSILSGIVAPGVEVVVEPLEDAPPSVESQVDIAIVGSALVRQASQWIGRDLSAAVIGCFSDPALAALREIVDMPVVGPGESAVHLAAQFGDRFGILSSEPTPKGLHARFRALGMSDLFVSERLVGCSVVDIAQRPEAAFDGIAEAAKGCVRDGADILVLGCLGMGFQPGLVDRLRREAGVPVVNPVVAALKTAEAALALGLSSTRSGRNTDERVGSLADRRG